MACDGFMFSLGTTKTKQLYRITLSESGVEWFGEGDSEKKAKTQTARFADIVGCSCYRGRDEKDVAAYMDLIYYPFTNKGILGKKFIRKRCVSTFSYTQGDTYEVNLAKLRAQEQVIMDKATSLLQTAPNDSVVGAGTHIVKPLLILINPKAGNGSAKRIFYERVKPMLDEANVLYTVTETENPGHGASIAKDVDLASIYGIVIVSGDGLTYEVYQGLMAREDWHTAVKTPIGVLPGGSGNALCCSINYAACEPFLDNFALHSTYILLKHKIQPMDLLVLDTQDGRRYSFLSVTWGIISDIDIESERYRTLGNARFTIGAIARIINLRTYRARLSFKPVHSYEKNVKSRTESARFLRTSSEVLGDGEEMEERVRATSMPTELHLNNEPLPVESNDLTPDTLLANGDVFPEPSDKESLTPLLPPLDAPVPEDWVTLEDSFITVCALYQTHLGPDTICAPSAKLSDGIIYLMIVRAPVPRGQLVTIMGQMEAGTHGDNPHVELVPVKAFRLEPLTSFGNIAVDGELVSYGPIQGQICQGMARVMA